MTVRVSKTEFNLREKLSELDLPVGNHGSQLMKSSSPEESFFLTQAGRKNHIINGACNVWQRGNASIVQTDFANYGCDRFWFANGATQIDRSTETPEKKGFCYSMKVTQSSTGASIGQPIELIGTGKSQFKPGQRYTLSVWAKTDSVVSNNLTFVAYYRNSKFSGTNQVNWGPSENPFAGQMTKKWKRFSHSFIAPEVNSNNTILALEFSFSATAYFTGFQLEEDDLTEFEHRSIAEELALCQRYAYRLGGLSRQFQLVGNGFIGVNGSTKCAKVAVALPTTMRASPDASVIGTDAFWGSTGGAFTDMTVTLTSNTGGIWNAASNGDHIWLDFGRSSGGTPDNGTACVVYTKNNNQGEVFLSAEL